MSMSASGGPRRKTSRRGRRHGRARVASTSATADLYAVHEFPFTAPGGPRRMEGRAAIADFLETVPRSLPLHYSSVADRFCSIVTHERDAVLLRGGEFAVLREICIIRGDRTRHD